MPTEREVIEGVLGKALNFSTEEVAALYDAEGPKDDALQSILDKRASVVQAEKAKAKKDRDEQLMRGRKEGGKKWEDFLRSEGVDLGDLTGESEEAFAKVKEHLAAVKTPTGPETDEAKVKSSPIFNKREKELLAQLAKKDEEWSAKWSERDAKETRERTLSVAKKKFREEFDARNPILPKDPKKAKNLLDLLDQKFEGYDFDLSDDGLNVEAIKDKDGKRIETPQGNPMKFSDFAKDLGDQYFEFAAGTPKTSAGDVTKGTKASGGLAGKKPANDAEYQGELARILSEVEDPKDRAAQTKALRELYTEAG